MALPPRQRPHIEPITHYRCLRGFFSENCLWLSREEQRKSNDKRQGDSHFKTVWRKSDGQSQPADCNLLSSLVLKIIINFFCGFSLSTLMCSGEISTRSNGIIHSQMVAINYTPRLESPKSLEN